MNGTVNFTSSDKSTFQSNVEFYCDPGYELNGTKSGECSENGTWNVIAPKCTIKGDNDLFFS